VGIHRQLREYINKNGLWNINQHIAHLSHKIFKSHGLKGHLVRQKVRWNLKRYAHSISGGRG